MQLFGWRFSFEVKSSFVIKSQEVNPTQVVPVFVVVVVVIAVAAASAVVFVVFDVIMTVL